MHEKPICQLLYDSLAAALMERDFQGPEIIKEWGEAVRHSLRICYPEYFGQEHLILRNARNSLGQIMFSENRDFLLDGALKSPEGFLRTLVMLADNNRLVAEQDAISPTIH